MNPHKGKYIILIDCPEEIPCDPCVSACPKGIIGIGGQLRNLPRVGDEGKCAGCGMCVAVCPGHAIFLVDRDHSEECFAITIPYEFRETPKRGDTVIVTDQDGNKVCSGRVATVKRNEAYKQTTLIVVAIEKKHYPLLKRMKGINRHER